MQKKLWADALKKQVAVEEIEPKSRALQDHICGDYCSNPLILDIFYEHLLPKKEKNE